MEQLLFLPPSSAQRGRAGSIKYAFLPLPPDLLLCICSTPDVSSGLDMR